MKRVYILIVNWNGWQDTLECLESVFRLDYPDYRVVVCDNGSTDGSCEKIIEWADSYSETVAGHKQPVDGNEPAQQTPFYEYYESSFAEKGGLVFHSEDPGAKDWLVEQLRCYINAPERLVGLREAIKGLARFDAADELIQAAQKLIEDHEDHRR